MKQPQTVKMAYNYINFGGMINHIMLDCEKSIALGKDIPQHNKNSNLKSFLIEKPKIIITNNEKISQQEHV